MLHDGRLDEIPQVTRDESLRRYVEQRVALKAQIAQESRTLLPQHPRMKELAGELAGLDAEIRLEADKTVAALQSDAKLAAADADGLSAALAKQSKTVASGNADDVQLRALQLDAKTAGDQLESYLEKYREAVAREAGNAAPADARIIAAAGEPRIPTFPKKVPTILLATLAGFLVSFGAVVAHALMIAPETIAPPAPRRARQDEAVDQAGELAPTAPQPPAVEPAVAPSEPVAIASPSPPPASEAPALVEPAAAPILVEPAPRAETDGLLTVAALADRLAAIGPKEGAALTAMIAGEVSGRAAGLALALGRRLAPLGRAALIDLGDYPRSTERPVDLSEDQPGAGLAELLDGRASFAEALHRDRLGGLDIIPAGDGAVAVERLGEALAALGASYDYLILHAYDWRSPPARAARDAVAVLAVAAANPRLGAALAEARQALAKEAIVVVGVKSGESSAAELVA